MPPLPSPPRREERKKPLHHDVTSCQKPPFHFAFPNAPSAWPPVQGVAPEANGGLRLRIELDRAVGSPLDQFDARQ